MSNESHLAPNKSVNIDNTNQEEQNVNKDITQPQGNQDNEKTMRSQPNVDDEEKNKVLSDLFDNISILFCSYDLNKYDFEKKKTIRNNINYARCMEKYFNENNMYSESNSILKEIIVEMISYYANYKEFDTIDISLRGR